MTADNGKRFFTVSHRSALHTFVIILILVMGIAGALVTGKWLMTTILANSQPRNLENEYDFFPN
jgi:hypothetical protein